MWVVMEHEYTSKESMWFDSEDALSDFLADYDNRYWSVDYYIR